MPDTDNAGWGRAWAAGAERWSGRGDDVSRGRRQFGGRFCGRIEREIPDQGGRLPRHLLAAGFTLNIPANFLEDLFHGQSRNGHLAHQMFHKRTIASSRAIAGQVPRGGGIGDNHPLGGVDGRQSSGA